MRRFVMADVHGSYKALVQCLERSGFDRDNDQLIQLGDVTDGYPDVFECVKELLKIKNLISLRGNHDEWFREFIESGYHPAGWSFGAIATAKSYLRLTGRDHLYKKVGEGYKTALDSRDIPATHQHFFEQQKPYFIDEDNNCFVHAGFNRQLPFSRQRRETFYWDRELWKDALDFHTLKRRGNYSDTWHCVPEFHEIFTGHTPTTNWGTDKPMRAINILNLDTGAGQSGRLTIMDICSKEYWQSDPVSELYEMNARKFQSPNAILYRCSLLSGVII